MSGLADDLRLAVFDCDGTIVDSQAAIIGCVADAWRAEGLTPPSSSAVRQIVGLSLPAAMAALAEPEQDIDPHRMADHYRRAFRQRREAADIDEPLYPGFLQAIDALEADGFLLGIATGKGRPGLIHTLQSHGLSDRFVTLQTSDRAAGKPHPEMLHNAMADCGAAPEQTVMIGDTSFDMEMALNAKCHAIGVTWGYHSRARLSAAGAHQIIENYDTLLPTARDLITKVGQGRREER